MIISGQPLFSNFEIKRPLLGRKKNNRKDKKKKEENMPDGTVWYVKRSALKRWFHKYTTLINRILEVELKNWNSKN